MEYFICDYVRNCGILYVNPYQSATWAELYKTNRETAIASGIATREELPGLQKEMDE